MLVILISRCLEKAEVSGKISKSVLILILNDDHFRTDEFSNFEDMVPLFCYFWVQAANQTYLCCVAPARHTYSYRYDIMRYETLVQHSSL